MKWLPIINEVRRKLKKDPLSTLSKNDMDPEKIRRELMKWEKEDLVKLIGSLSKSLQVRDRHANTRTAQLSSYRRRLRSIKRQIDYMLSHPYTTGSAGSMTKSERASKERKVKTGEGKTIDYDCEQLTTK